MKKLFLYGQKELFQNISQKELIEYKWLFKKNLMKIIY
jgi:hypothetical protein